METIFISIGQIKITVPYAWATQGKEEQKKPKVQYNKHIAEKEEARKIKDKINKNLNVTTLFFLEF